MSKVLGRWHIGVCSWSYRLPLEDVARQMAELNIRHIHLAVAPALQEGVDDWVAKVKSYGWVISSTMINFPQEDYSTLDSIRRTGGIVPDDCWEQNRQMFFGAVDVTKRLRARFLSFHAGFLDHTDEAYARTFEDRIRELADHAFRAGVQVLLETGQESAADLRAFLQKLAHPALRVNFDPANMILYGKGEPVAALGQLAPWIRHVHIKDAKPAARPGDWGTEVAWGEGDAGANAFLKELAKAGFNGALAVEREAGDDRVGDIRKAVHRCLAAT